MRVADGVRTFRAGLLHYFRAPWRTALARKARDEEDLFLLMIFSESLGIANPVSFYTLELQPIMLERFHAWHTRMGMERSPLDGGFGCC